MQFKMPLFKFTDWEIDSAGRVKHTACNSSYYKLSQEHHCWVPKVPYEKTSTGYEMGKWMNVQVPETIRLIAQIQADVFGLK